MLEPAGTNTEYIYYNLNTVYVDRSIYISHRPFGNKVLSFFFRISYTFSKKLVSYLIYIATSNFLSWSGPNSFITLYSAPHL